MICKINGFLAYAMAAYIMASIYYMVVTRRLGTPFNDTLTEEQRQVKAASATARSNAFYQGVFLSALVLSVFRPFSQC